MKNQNYIDAADVAGKEFFSNNLKGKIVIF